MNTIALNFNENRVRTVMDDNGEPLFNAKDVCECLGLGNSSQAIKILEDDEKGVISTDTLGGKQDMVYVTESGLYLLIFSSRKPEAKVFTRWVTKEVLPTIRKTGSYTLGGFDNVKFYNEHKALNPNYEFTIEFKDIKAKAYKDSTYSFLISGVELAKLIGKTAKSLRVMKLYHKDIVKKDEAFVKLGEVTYYTKKGVEIMALHSHNKEFSEYIHSKDFNPKLLIA